METRRIHRLIMSVKYCRGSPYCLLPSIYLTVVHSYKTRDLYDIVTNVNSYPQFLPFCTGARVLSTTPLDERHGNAAGVKMEAEMTVGFMSFTETYTSEVTCIPYQSVEVSFSTHSIAAVILT